MSQGLFASEKIDFATQIKESLEAKIIVENAYKIYLEDIKADFENIPTGIKLVSNEAFFSLESL